mmetsp:Transcript_3197/g.9268  ORF Transcript_3197/g.9268 Transcript_3197/m.9268 type:complete len:206 (+) Transcript_3197:188-805(+)
MGDGRQQRTAQSWHSSNLSLSSKMCAVRLFGDRHAPCEENLGSVETHAVGGATVAGIFPLLISLLLHPRRRGRFPVPSFELLQAACWPSLPVPLCPSRRWFLLPRPPRAWPRPLPPPPPLPPPLPPAPRPPLLRRGPPRPPRPPPLLRPPRPPRPPLRLGPCFPAVSSGSPKLLLSLATAEGAPVEASLLVAAADASNPTSSRRR